MNVKHSLQLTSILTSGSMYTIAPGTETIVSDACMRSFKICIILPSACASAEAAAMGSCHSGDSVGRGFK